MVPVFIISLLASEKRRNSCIEHCHSINLDPIWFKAVNGYEILENIKKEKDERFPPQDNEFKLLSSVTLRLALGQKVTVNDQLTAGELGCALSHLRIYKKMIDEKIETALILEDDCELLPAFKDILPEILIHVKKWDIVQILHNSGIRDFFIKKTIRLKHNAFINHEGMSFLNPIFNRRRVSFITSCYFINLNGAKRLYQLGIPARLPADYLLGLVSFHGLRLYTLHPQGLFAKLAGSESTISNKNICPRPKHKLE